jgi:hypothetical protein
VVASLKAFAQKFSVHFTCSVRGHSARLAHLIVFILIVYKIGLLTVTVSGWNTAHTVRHGVTFLKTP